MSEESTARSEDATSGEKSGTVFLGAPDDGATESVVAKSGSGGSQRRMVSFDVAGEDHSDEATPDSSLELPPNGPPSDLSSIASVTSIASSRPPSMT